MSERKAMGRRICVVGAGTAGIVATKTALQESDESSEIICYERSKSLGGIWWYRPDETEQTTVSGTLAKLGSPAPNFTDCRSSRSL